MAYPSLREKKIAYIQKQQAELKKNLLGKKNTNAVNEVPLMRRIMVMNREEEMKRRKKGFVNEKIRVNSSIHQNKISMMKKNKKQMKKPKSKISIKSFY